jgi:dihydrodipicolinate synthase/N-acetylneuraminate lyase
MTPGEHMLCCLLNPARKRSGSVKVSCVIKYIVVGYRRWGHPRQRGGERTMNKVTKRKFEGVYPAMVTPLNKNHGIDEDGLRYEVDYLIKSRVQGLVALGSSGEYPYLTLSEKKKVIDIVVEQTKGRVPVIVCTSSMGTDEVIMLSKYAKRRGADGLMITLPIYFPLTDDDVFNHYKSIAKAVDLPILLYDFPYTTHF